VGRVAGVFDNPPGFPCTPPGVDVLEGGKLTSNNVAGSSNYLPEVFNSHSEYILFSNDHDTFIGVNFLP